MLPSAPGLMVHDNGVNPAGRIRGPAEHCGRGQVGPQGTGYSRTCPVTGSTRAIWLANICIVHAAPSGPAVITVGPEKRVGMPKKRRSAGSAGVDGEGRCDDAASDLMRR